MANPSPQHNPTDGLGTADVITLAGTGVTLLTPGVYQVSLNVSASPNPSSVAITSTVKDVAGTTFTSGNSNTVAGKSYNTNVATVAAGTITAVARGQAVVEFTFPTHDTTDGVDVIYVQILVTVGA